MIARRRRGGCCSVRLPRSRSRSAACICCSDGRSVASPTALGDARARAALGLFAAGVVVLFAVQHCATGRSPRTRSCRRRSPRPTRDSCGSSPARCAPERRCRRARRWTRPDPRGRRRRVPDLHRIVRGDRLREADVAPGLAAPRAELAAAIQATGRDVVSAFVDSPTFGGSSWLAHLSLMSGVEVRDPETNARLLTEQRDTMVTNFKRRGFRAIALMPGLRQRWPEGAFYGFDDITARRGSTITAPSSDGSPFPTSSRSRASTRSRQIARTVRTCSSSIRRSARIFHFSRRLPISPTGRACSTRIRSMPARSCRRTTSSPTGGTFRPATSTPCRYTYRTLAGYLRRRASPDSVIRHPWRSSAGGRGQRRRRLVERARARGGAPPGGPRRALARGFRRGLAPARPALGRMHALLPILLDAFGGRQPSAPSTAATRTRVVISN